MAERKYPDTSKGAIDMLRADSDLNPSSQVKAIPDPSHKGVWLIEEPNKWAAVVYLGGYEGRTYNDFETDYE